MSFAPAQRRPETSAPGDSSRTVTITDAPPREEETPSSPPAVGALKLRGGHRKVRQKVVWGEDVIDNEGCGKKKSKICCIYHKPKRFDESSDESSSDSDSDSSFDDGRARASRSHRSSGHHTSNRGGGAAQAHRGGGDGVVHELESDDEANAYEANPSSKKGKRKA